MAQSVTKQLNQFYGLRENQSGDLTLQDGELSRCDNCRITDNLKIQKRDGYTEIFDIGSGGAIRGMWYGRVNGTNKFVFARDGRIYEGNLSTGATTDIGLITDTRAFFFGFADKVYVQNGAEYLVWDGAGSFVDVRTTAYIPLVAINVPPAGGGTAFEEINTLTGKKYVQFDGDGASATYQLPETSIDSVDSVTVDGVLKTVTTDYTVNLTNGTVSPVTPADFTSGTNNIFLTTPDIGILLFSIKTARFSFEVSDSTSLTVPTAVPSPSSTLHPISSSIQNFPSSSTGDSLPVLYRFVPFNLSASFRSSIPMNLMTETSRPRSFFCLILLTSRGILHP